MSNSRDDDNDNNNNSDKSRRRSHKDFLPAGELTTPALTRSHAANFVTKVVRADELRKLKHQHFWVLKKAEDLRAAEQEKHAQEYLRVLIPHQPKTRVVRDENNQAYVLSKAIPGFVSLDEMIFENMPPGLTESQQSWVAGIRARVVNQWFKDREDFKDLKNPNELRKLYDSLEFLDLNIKGLNQIDLQTRAPGLGELDGNDAAMLGELMITSIKVYEIDFKLANIGKNKEKRLVKIDGDQTYEYPHQIIQINGSVVKAPKAPCPPITADVINKLPWIHGSEYPAFNWLDMRQHGADNPLASICGGGAMKQFRSGVNRGILKMLLLPDDLEAKQTRADISVAVEAEAMIHFDHERKQGLKLAALNTPSFREYLNSNEAQQIKAEFLQNLFNHKIESNIRLVDDPVKTTKEVEETFNELRKIAEAKNFLENFSFILNNYAKNYTVKSLLNESFIDSYQKNINSAGTEKDKIEALLKTAKEGKENAPKLSLADTLFGKTPSAKNDIQQLHKIILLFEKNPGAAIVKMRDLRNEFFKSADENISTATNSTRPPGPRGGH